MARNVILTLRLRLVAIFFLVALFFSTLSCGGTSNETVSFPQIPAPDTATPEPAEPEPAPQKAFLWKAVSSENESKVIYLLGSVHMASPDMYPLDPVIEEAYDASEVLVVELDINAISPQEQIQLVLTKASLPPGQTLEDKVSPETWSKLKSGLAKFNIPLETVSRFKPWFAGLTLVALRISAAGFSPELGIDRYFLKKGGKQISALETAESQLSLFDNMAPELEELFLLDSLEAPMEDDYYQKMMNSWVSGDAKFLQDMVFNAIESEPEFGPLYKRIFDDRNQAMAKGIDELLKTHNTLFVVVGAGHLVGKEGLVAIFENKGYAVTQLEKKEVKNGLSNSSK